MSINGPIIGTLVVAGFGGAWAVYGACALSARYRLVAITAAIAISAALAAGSLHTRTVAHHFVLSTYFLSVAFEIVAIVVVTRALRRSNRRTLIGPVIAIIVGLHFIGLWLATGDMIFVWLTIALCAVGSCAMRLRPTMRVAGAGFGSAAVLWSSALIMILR